MGTSKNYNVIGTQDEEALSALAHYDQVINHPYHYTDKGMECIDEMELVFGIDDTIAFCKLNAWKYRYRANAKGGQDDLDKADWYLNKLKELTDKKCTTLPTQSLGDYFGEV